MRCRNCRTLHACSRRRNKPLSRDDLALADELLRGAARIQEAELGPLHPDLANTLNNLAIVAEKTGRLDDAETFYRRAVAIASASLPADHPMIAASRENLEDFCRAHGLPIDPPAFMTPARDTAGGLDAFAREGAAGAAETPADVGADDAGFSLAATRPPSGSPSPFPANQRRWLLSRYRRLLGELAPRSRGRRSAWSSSS